MELDDYKVILKQIPVAGFSNVKPATTNKNLGNRAKSMMTSIKRSLRIEISFALVFIIVDIYIALFSTYAYLRVFSCLLLVFCIYCLIYLVKLLRFIHQLERVIVSVKHLLQNYIFIIQRFSRLYFQLTMVMIPLIIVMVFVAGYLNYRFYPTKNLLAFSPERIWRYSGIGILWTVSMYFFTKWYIKRLYGDYLSILKQMLSELENDE